MDKNKALMIKARQVGCSNPFERLAGQYFRDGEQSYMEFKKYIILIKRKNNGSVSTVYTQE